MMTPQQFGAWMHRNGLDTVQVQAKTGLARSTIRRYLDGSTRIPKVVALACAAIDNEIDVDN
jgi:predicted DNA-binding transcriptional regulator AlpA